jgi:Raf kinase inhibitor-like YbhB/YbcL family protein
MKITSEAFPPGAKIPDVYAKLGGNQNPPLHFEDVPEKARSLVLIVDDPDAPRGLFTHWVVFNIDPALTHFPENSVPDGVRQAKNGWGEAAYGGPQPPDREHRYLFRLSALDTTLGLPDGTSRAEVEKAMQGHVIASAEMMGRFAPHAMARQ